MRLLANHFLVAAICRLDQVDVEVRVCQGPLDGSDVIDAARWLKLLVLQFDGYRFTHSSEPSLLLLVLFG